MLIRHPHLTTRRKHCDVSEMKMCEGYRVIFGAATRLYIFRHLDSKPAFLTHCTVRLPKQRLSCCIHKN